MQASFFGTASVLSILCASVISVAHAQDQVPGEVADVAGQDTVIVTGTRIKGLESDGAVQALSLSRDELIETGSASLIEALKELPVTGGGRGTFSTSTAGALSGDTPPGAASVSLRGLGPSSTLTLINGRRASITSFAVGQENFIDVNALPFAAVERVEVLPNGASAIYGADAIAGVVNYVLRDDFNGFEVSGLYGNSTADTDEGKFNLNAVWGRADDTHSVMLVADYYKRNAFFDRDRDITANSVRPSEQGFYPSFNDLFLMFFDQTEEPGDGGCSADNFGFGDFGEFCTVNTNAFTSTEDAYESIGLMGSYKMFIGDRTTWFNEIIFSHNESEGTSSPANFSRAPVDPENPNFPQALVDDIVEEANFDNPGTVYQDFFGFPIYAWGKFLEPRAVEVESQTLRLVTGIEHELENGWNIEAGAVYGRNDSEQRGISGLIQSEAFYNSLVGNLCSDGTVIDRWDVDPERPDASFNGGSCEDAGKTTLWYNPFGGQTDQPEGLAALIETDAERNGEAQMVQLDFTASGDIMEFGAGSIAGAFGAEFRYEELEDKPADVAVATRDNPNPVLGFSSTSAEAERSQWAAYGELYVPFTERLSMQIAGRYDWTDDYGDSFNPKVALRFEPVDGVVLRGNWSTSFRAPSLAQIGADVRLTSYRTDCSVTPEACGGDAQSDGVALLSEEVGNRDLQPEEAESYSIGAVFEPTPDTEITLDFWNIRHEDLIGVDEDDFIRRALAGEFTVINVDDGFLPTGTPGLEVTDDPNGAGVIVTDAHFSLTNLGFQETSGIDASITQYVDLGAGRLTLGADAGYLLKFDRKASANAPLIEEAGEFSYPELLLRGSVGWRQGPWRLSSRVFYTSSYDDDPSQRIVDAAIENGFVSADTTVDREIDAWTTVDLSASYDFAEDSFIQLSVENVFDEEPPLALATGANVDFYNHDTMGRFVTLRINKAF
jgi:outer membrane receptor protein involved in Fe transport